MPDIPLSALRGFIFDMDGVIYRGNDVIPGAPEMVAHLRHANVPFVFLTNNATTPAERVAARLRGMGIPATGSDVITSADVTAAVLAEAMPGARALVVGEEGIRQALLDRGFRLTDSHREADLVVAALDRGATYATLKEAALAIRRGAPFYATNLDPNLPSEEGLIPGAGALAGLLQIATGVKPVAFGKPEPGILLYALRHLGTPAHLTAAVGDRPDTDVLGGQRAGLRTIAVLTGAGTAEAFAGMEPPPDWVFPDLVALRNAYFGGKTDPER